MEKVLTQLTEKLNKTYGTRLVSTILYGSAAVGDHDTLYSDFNVFCVLTAITPVELGDAEPIFHWWRELGNPSPLLMGRDEVSRATDCFPMEFHDMQERRKVLHGEDVVANLTINDVHYRAQVEHELRSKLIRLRQKAGGVLSDRELLLRLMADSVSTFCVLGRHALRLHGVHVSPVKREIVAGLRSSLGVAATAFDTLLDLRENKRKERDVEPVALLGSYLKEIETIIDPVDRIER